MSSAVVVGDMVRVKAPFDIAFPDLYEVSGINPDTGAYQICGDRDFSPEYLEKAE